MAGEPLQLHAGFSLGGLKTPHTSYVTRSIHSILSVHFPQNLPPLYVPVGVTFSPLPGGAAAGSSDMVSSTEMSQDNLFLPLPLLL